MAKKKTSRKTAKKKTAKKTTKKKGLQSYTKSVYGAPRVKSAKKRIADAERAYKKAVRESLSKYKKRKR